jgi:hypothetical protein
MPAKLTAKMRTVLASYAKRIEHLGRRTTLDSDSRSVEALERRGLVEVERPTTRTRRASQGRSWWEYECSYVTITEAGHAVLQES